MVWCGIQNFLPKFSQTSCQNWSTFLVCSRNGIFEVRQLIRRRLPSRYERRLQLQGKRDSVRCCKIDM